MSSSYQSSSNPAETARPPQEYETTTYDTCCRSNTCERIKLVVASMAVFLLILVVFVGVALGYSVLQVFPLVNYFLMFGCLLLLAYVEALHYAVVAIEKWDMTQYAERYPRAVKCHALVDTPEKVKKFLVGRQFFVIFVVFLLAQITTFETVPDDFAGLPSIMVLLFVKTGLPGVFLTLTVGQLISQIFVEEFTLQFMNLYGCEFVIRLSLSAEWIGVCNFSWLLYGTVSRIMCHKVIQVQRSMDSGKFNATVSQQPLAQDPLSPTEKIRGKEHTSTEYDWNSLTWFDCLKYLWSTFATLGSVLVICYGISIQSYVLPTPVAGAYIIAISLLVILFYLEGLMIAIVGTQYWDPDVFRDVYPRAYKLHRLMNQPENVKRFIIGRQFFTVLTNFLLAQIFTFHGWSSDGYNPVLFYIVVRSGLVGVLVVLAFAQLLPELLAAEYPLRFMNMLGSNFICNTSLFFDSLGVGHCAWSIYFTTRSLVCGGQMAEDGKACSDSKPTILRIQSAEVLAETNRSQNTV